ATPGNSASYKAMLPPAPPPQGERSKDRCCLRRPMFRAGKRRVCKTAVNSRSWIRPARRGNPSKYPLITHGHPTFDKNSGSCRNILRISDLEICLQKERTQSVNDLAKSCTGFMSVAQILQMQMNQ